MATEAVERDRGAVVHAGWLAGAARTRGGVDPTGAATGLGMVTERAGAAAPVAAEGGAAGAPAGGDQPGGGRPLDATDVAGGGAGTTGGSQFGADAIGGDGVGGNGVGLVADPPSDWPGGFDPARATTPAPASTARGEDERLAAAIGARLGRARAARGISQERLARLTGVERPTVCRWERGLRLPSVAALMRAAAVLGVPASDLLP